MKVAGILFLLLMGAALFAQTTDLTKTDGYDWVLRYTQEQKEQFVSGFLLGAFSAAMLSIQFFSLTFEETKILWFQDVTNSQVIDEVDMYYYITKDYDTPLYIAIYRRLFLKD